MGLHRPVILPGLYTEMMSKQSPHNGSLAITFGSLLLLRMGGTAWRQVLPTTVSIVFETTMFLA